MSKFTNQVKSSEIVSLFVFSMASLIWVVSKNLDEIGQFAAFAVCLYVTSALVVEIVTLSILRRYLYRKNYLPQYIYLTVLSLVFTFNIYAIVFVHTTSGASFYKYILITCVGLFCVPYLMFRFNTWRAANMLGCVLIALLVFQLAWAKREKGVVGLGLPDSWQAGNFASKPDVYLLSFDALIPDEIAGFFLNSPEPSYSSYLRSEGFREVEPTMATEVPNQGIAKCHCRHRLRAFEKTGDARTAI